MDTKSMFKNIKTVTENGIFGGSEALGRFKRIAKESGIKMHDEGWLKGYRAKNGMLPRVKKMKNGEEFDINTEGVNLPAEFLEFNETIAFFVAVLLTIYNDVDIEHAAAVIHMKWLEMSPWAKGGELDVDYEKLSEEEKDKDRDVYSIVCSNL